MVTPPPDDIMLVTSTGIKNPVSASRTNLQFPPSKTLTILQVLSKATSAALTRISSVSSVAPVSLGIGPDGANIIPSDPRERLYMD